MLVAHADWGVDRRKRWIATAEGDASGGWRAGPARLMPVGANDDAELRHILDVEAGQTLVIGFDFPIGVPRSWARKAGVDRFVDLLPELGQGDWSEFFDVADNAQEISLHRPFYPLNSGKKGDRKQSHLTEALGLSMNDLRRRCEHKQSNRAAACSLFWTLGGNQVGKGALSGWRILKEQPRGSVRYWPFDGPLDQLVKSSQTVVVETYPAEFYGHLGLPPVIGKRKQESRRSQSAALLAAADHLDVELDPALRSQIEDGFGHSSSGEDAFDAVVGLLGMINVLSGNRPSGEPRDDESVTTIEGWILGQEAIDVDPRNDDGQRPERAGQRHAHLSVTPTPPTAERTAATNWFTVRCLFRFVFAESEESVGTYEERLTIWRSESIDHAIEQAEAEAVDYANDLDGCEYLGLAQACQVPVEGAIGSGDEIYALMRDSRLEPSAYIDHFFDTGDERQQHV